jgi:hypothetical protein
MIPKRNVFSFKSGYQRTIKVRTTLFDLLKVLNEEVGVGEERRVGMLITI